MFPLLLKSAEIRLEVIAGMSESAAELGLCYRKLPSRQTRLQSRRLWVGRPRTDCPRSSYCKLGQCRFDSAQASLSPGCPRLPMECVVNTLSFPFLALSVAALGMNLNRIDFCAPVFPFQTDPRAVFAVSCDSSLKPGCCWQSPLAKSGKFTEVTHSTVSPIQFPLPLRN